MAKSKKPKKIVPTGASKRKPSKKGEMSDEQAGNAAGGITLAQSGPTITIDGLVPAVQSQWTEIWKSR